MPMGWKIGDEQVQNPSSTNSRCDSINENAVGIGCMKKPETGPNVNKYFSDLDMKVKHFSG